MQSTRPAGPPELTVRGAKARQGSLREHNLALVMSHVYRTSPAPSRADVAAATGLTRATVSTLVDQLVDAGLVRELEPVSGQIGRPATPLAPAGGTVVALGLEANVGYLGVRAVDLVGEVLGERIEDGDFHRSDPATVLGRLGELARAVAADVTARGARVVGATLALPGLVDERRAALRVAPNLGWSAVEPIGLLGPLPFPVAVGNEANLAGLAQLPRGTHPAGGAQTYLYLSAEVGVGGAVVVDGELYTGRHGWAGEIGHVVVDPDGPPCTCGSQGCLEQLAGKDALMRGAGLDPALPFDAFVAALDGPEPAAARRSLDRAAEAIAVGLSGALNLLDLDTAFLGGIYAPVHARLEPVLGPELRRRVLASRWEDLRVQVAPVTDHPALTGAARAVLRQVVAHPAGYLPVRDA